MNSYLSRFFYRLLPLCTVLISMGCGGGNEEDAYADTPCVSPLPSQIESVEFFTLSQGEDTVHIGDLFEQPNILSFTGADASDTIYDAPIVSGNFRDTLNATTVEYTPGTGTRICWFKLEDLSYTPADGHTISGYLFEVIIETYNPDTRELTGWIQNIYVTCSGGNVITRNASPSNLTTVTFQLRSGTAGTTTDPTVENP